MRSTLGTAAAPGGAQDPVPATPAPEPDPDGDWRLWLPDGVASGFHAETPGNPSGLVHAGDSWATPAYGLARHAHRGAWEIYAQLAGTARFRVADTVLHVAPGWVFAVAPGVPHGYDRPRAGVRQHFAYAAVDLSVVAARRPGLAHGWSGPLLSTAEGWEVHAPLRALVREVGAARPLASVALEAALHLTLVAAVRAFSAAGAARPRIAAHPAVARARQLLEADPARPWTVESLAAAVGLSRSQLAQQYAREVGETPAAHLTRVRVELAADLLRDTARSVDQIAAEVGFASGTVLARAFRTHRGTTPTQWRGR